VGLVRPPAAGDVCICPLFRRQQPVDPHFGHERDERERAVEHHAGLRAGRASGAGPLMPALARLRAKPHTPAQRGASCMLEGEIPAARVHELQQQLPALTCGEGVLEYAFYRYGTSSIAPLGTACPSALLGHHTHHQDTSQPHRRVAALPHPAITIVVVLLEAQ